MRRRSSPAADCISCCRETCRYKPGSPRSPLWGRAPPPASAIRVRGALELRQAKPVLKGGLSVSILKGSSLPGPGPPPPPPPPRRPPITVTRPLASVTRPQVRRPGLCQAASPGAWHGFDSDSGADSEMTNPDRAGPGRAGPGPGGGGKDSTGALPQQQLPRLGGPQPDRGPSFSGQFLGPGAQFPLLRTGGGAGRPPSPLLSQRALHTGPHPGPIWRRLRGAGGPGRNIRPMPGPGRPVHGSRGEYLFRARVSGRLCRRDRRSEAGSFEAPNRSMVRSQGGDLRPEYPALGPEHPQHRKQSPTRRGHCRGNCQVAPVQWPTRPFPGLFRVGKNGQRSRRPRPAHSSGPFPPVSGTTDPSRCDPDSDRLALFGAAAGFGIGRGLVARGVAELADGLDCQQARKESPACFEPMRLHPGQWPSSLAEKSRPTRMS